MTTLNHELASLFLEKQTIKNFTIDKIAGDASFRSYYRISCPDKSYVLMYAPPLHEDIKPFIKVDELLIFLGFSAPKIFAIDHENGFLLLEDFGFDTYNKLLLKQPEREFELYKLACDVLVKIYKSKCPKDLPSYDNNLLLRETMLFVEWYLPMSSIVMSDEDVSEFKSLMLQLFSLINRKHKILVLRDYHADNLMLLADRKGYEAVGLLDFQDAVIGSCAYDLVSLLEDARRDLNSSNKDQLFSYYQSQINEDIETDYQIFSLQRNLKILGIFARLAKRDGKNAYLAMIPRVFKFVIDRLVTGKNESSAIVSQIFLQLDELLFKYGFQKLKPDQYQKIPQKILGAKGNSAVPSSSLRSAEASIVADLELLSNVFQSMENEAAEIAELIFDHLVDASDEEIFGGKIPTHKNPRINSYIQLLNRLFKLARTPLREGGFKIVSINRKVIQSIDKKTFAICMCCDGGEYLDIMCDVVNTEVKSRIPTTSPVVIRVIQAFAENKENIPVIRN